MATSQQKLSLMRIAKSDPGAAMLALFEMLRTEMEKMMSEKMAKVEAELPNAVILKHIEKLKGEKGEPGVKGYTPIKGKDYKDGANGLNGNTPKKYVDYFTVAEVNELKTYLLSKINMPSDGKTPVRGVDYFTKADIQLVTDLVSKKVKPQAGKDYPTNEQVKKMVDEFMKSVTLDEIMSSLEKIMDSKIQSKVRNLGKKKHGGHGGFGVMSDQILLPTSGTINEDNLSFVFAEEPSILIINGGAYKKTGGAITWTWTISTKIALLSSPVGLNGTIWGIR